MAFWMRGLYFWLNSDASNKKLKVKSGRGRGTPGTVRSLSVELLLLSNSCSLFEGCSNRIQTYYVLMPI